MPCKDFVEQDLTILVSPKKCLPHKTRIPPLKTLKTHSKNQTIEIFFPIITFLFLITKLSDKTMVEDGNYVILPRGKHLVQYLGKKNREKHDTSQLAQQGLRNTLINS